jgi:hypothetical protein
MKTITTIISLVLQISFAFGQVKEILFPLSPDKTVFDCPQTFLHYEDDKNDSLDITPSISFFIDRTPVIFNKTSYYKFCKDSSCIGFLRRDNNKIFSIGTLDSIHKSKEKLLFDFGARKGKSWKTNMFQDFSNHKIKITLKNKYFNKDYDEYLFDFEISYSNTSVKSINNLIVGEKNGIVGVNFITHYGFYINCKRI